MWCGVLGKNSAEPILSSVLLQDIDLSPLSVALLDGEVGHWLSLELTGETDLFVSLVLVLLMLQDAESDAETGECCLEAQFVSLLVLLVVLCCPPWSTNSWTPICGVRQSACEISPPIAAGNKQFALAMFG